MKIHQGNFTRIPNDVLDHLLSIRIPGRARQVLDVIIRKSYGWSKQWDAISLNQFSDETMMDKRVVCRALNKLVEMNLICKRGNSRSRFSKTGNEFSTEYRVNADFKTWQPLPKKRTSKRIAKVVKIMAIKNHETSSQAGITQEPAAKPAAPIPAQKITDKPDPDSEIMKDIYRVGKELSSLNNGKKFNPWQWVEAHKKKNSHPGAMLKALTSLKEHWSTTKKPYGYAQRIMEIENGNFHEQDAIRESEKIAGDFKNLAGILKSAGLVPDIRAP